MNAIEIINAAVSNDLRKAIRACADLPVLEEALRMEEGKPGQVGDKGGPRASVIGALKLRVDTLRLVPGAPQELITIAPAQATPAPAPAVVVAEPAPVVEQVVDSPEQHCATTLIAALAKGDAPMLVTLVGLVRARADYDAGKLADALVGAYRAQAPGNRAQGARKPAAAPGTASERNVARIKAAVDGAQVVDGAVVLTAADMERAGFPASWVAHATCWYGASAQAGNAAKAAGYTPKHRKVNGQPQVVLAPVAAE